MVYDLPASNISRGASPNQGTARRAPT